MWKRGFASTLHPFCLSLARVAPIRYGRNAMYHPIRWYASFHWLKGTHSGVLLQAEPASVACEGWESYASGVPRRGVEHLRSGESELLRSATGWRKEKQRGRFQLASPAVRVAIVPLSILANLVRAVLVRARGAKRASR